MTDSQELLKLTHQHIDVTKDHFEMTKSFTQSQLDFDSSLTERLPSHAY